MKIRPPFLGSFVLGLALFYLFFLWQFPNDQMKKAMVQAFEELVPLNLSIGQVGTSFPANLRIENIRVSSDSLSFRVQGLTLHSNLLSLLFGKIHLAVRDLNNSSRLEIGYRQEKNKNQLNLQLNQARHVSALPQWD